MDLLESIAKGPLLLDGAMGSFLIAEGLQSGEIPELWNIENSEIITSIHKKYLDSGADAILTNTFGGSSLRLKEFGVEDRVEEIIINAVNNAKRATNGDKLIIGDIGPTGLFLPPVGNVQEADYFSSFQEQGQLLVNAGVDAILIETMSDLREAVQAVEAIRSFNDKIPIIATMTFDKKKKGYFTLMGNTPLESFRALEVAGANIVGANCTLNSADMVELVKEAVNLTQLPLLFQPNAGQPTVIQGQVVYPENPSEFAENITKIVNLGVKLVGGCCGTTPEHIYNMNLKLRRS